MRKVSTKKVGQYTRNGELAKYLIRIKKQQKKQYLVHRLVMQTFSKEPAKATVDHIDGIKTNNRYENLRWATMKEQSTNRRKMGGF